MDLGDPGSMTRAEINNDRLIHLPGRKQRVSMPIADIVLGSIDDSTRKRLFRLAIAAE